MEAADIKKSKDLEDVNRRLKQMFADLSLVCCALKDVIEKNFKPAIKRELVNYLTTLLTMSTRQACRTLFRYQPDTPRDEPVTQELTEVAERYPATELRRFFVGRDAPGTTSMYTGFTVC